MPSRRSRHATPPDGWGKPLRFLVAALLPLLTWTCSASGDSDSPRVIIVISMDTTRGDHFGFLGSPRVQTPMLDALAEESIVFPDFSTVVPTTLASHTTLFTGKYPHHHGTPRNGFMVNEDNEMLAEILRRAGYQTAAFIGSFALESRFDFNQGFDHYDETFHQFVGEGGADQNQRSAESINEAVLAFLDRQTNLDRLFLFVHYFDAHAPYTPPPPFDRAYDQRGRDGLLPLEAIRQDRTLDRQERLRQARRQALQYASEISYLDAQIGRLLDQLRDRNLLDDALLLITGDHGENLWEHNEPFGHGRTVHEATRRVVCMIRLPGGESGGRRVAGPISNIDILPTLLGFVGLDPPSDIDGRAVSLDPLGDVLPPRVVFGQATKPFNVESDPRWTNMLKSRFAKEGSYKLIQTPYRGTEELYDLATDREELRDLLLDPSPEIEEVAARLRSRLEAWAESADPLPSRFEPSQSQETRERLRSLGYIR